MTDTTSWNYYLAALQLKYGWFIAICAWQTSIRFVMVFLNAKLKEFMENALPADRDWLKALLNHRLYRVLVFIVNALLSIKLPTSAKGGAPQT